MIGPARIVLQSQAASAKAARDFLAHTCPAETSEILHDAQLLVSELVTNAVRYGLGPIEVDVACGPETNGIHVWVRDRAPELPHLRDATTHEEGGRGLTLLDTLSDIWGIDRLTPGKSVWFRLAAPS